jgi:hypothetical protein
MKVLRDLRAFKVLDPACGSGNFLALAYREMKRLELEILLKLRELAGYIRAKGSKGYKTVPPEALMNAVSIKQFHGMDILPFAAELAKVTLMVAKEMWIIENQQQHDSESLFAQESPLPLDNLDENIRCADALFAEWPKADAIIGNPPYLDARKLALEHGADYVSKLRSTFPGVPGRADLVTYFFRKAHDQLSPGGYAGLVGTNTIRQNYSREGGLDYVVQHDGVITEAVSAQVWSGEAAVHVSIVNWKKGEVAGMKRLHTQLGDHVDSPWIIEVIPLIPSSLTSSTDVTAAISLEANAKSPACFEGQQPGHNGFRLEADEALQLIRAGCSQVIFPYLGGDEMLSGAFFMEPRYIIDFGDRDKLEAHQFERALDVIRSRVLPDWEENAKREFAKIKKESGEHQNRLKTWWLLKRPRLAMINAISRRQRYIVCVRHTKRPVFVFVDPTIRPDSSLTVFPLEDDYSYGILQSDVHWHWFVARCSTIKRDFRYTSDTVFDSFPWPQEPTNKQMRAVADAAVALRQLRRDTMAKLDWSLRDLYRSLEEPGANPLRDAHAALDAAVRAAYGMGKNEDILTHLLALNHACAEKEKAGEKITPPGLPLPPKEHAAFITTDCIEAPKL